MRSAFPLLGVRATLLLMPELDKRGRHTRQSPVNFGPHGLDWIRDAGSPPPSGPPVECGRAKKKKPSSSPPGPRLPLDKTVPNITLNPTCGLITLLCSFGEQLHDD